MNTKVVVVLLVCVFLAAEAKPGGGKDDGKSSDSNKKPGSTPAPGAGKANQVANEKKPDKLPSVTQLVEGLKNLCNGLNTGSLKNTNTSYDAVFTAFGGVCTDLGTYLASQAVAPARRKRGGKEPPKGAGGAKVGQPSGKPAEGKHGAEPEENKALEALFDVCKGLERAHANLPTDLSADLASIFTKTGDVCKAANQVRKPAA